LIELAAFRLAIEDPSVEAALRRMRAAVTAIPAQPSPAKYLVLSAEAMGVPAPELTP
jgi:hypothetical protein